MKPSDWDDASIRPIGRRWAIEAYDIASELHNYGADASALRDKRPDPRVLARSAFRRCSPTSSWRFCSRCLGRKGLRINRSERMLQLLRSAWRDVGSAIIPAPGTGCALPPCTRQLLPIAEAWRPPGPRSLSPGPGISRGNGCFCPRQAPCFALKRWGSAPSSTSGFASLSASSSARAACAASGRSASSSQAVALAFGSFAVASAIFLILELNRPFSLLFRAD
jgi:hypothetical protein